MLVVYILASNVQNLIRYKLYMLHYRTSFDLEIFLILKEKPLSCKIILTRASIIKVN